MSEKRRRNIYPDRYGAPVEMLLKMQLRIERDLHWPRKSFNLLIKYLSCFILTRIDVFPSLAGGVLTVPTEYLNRAEDVVAREKIKPRLWFDLNEIFDLNVLRSDMGDHFARVLSVSGAWNEWTGQIMTPSPVCELAAGLVGERGRDCKPHLVRAAAELGVEKADAIEPFVLRKLIKDRITSRMGGKLLAEAARAMGVKDASNTGKDDLIERIKNDPDVFTYHDPCLGTGNMVLYAFRHNGFLDNHGRRNIYTGCEIDLDLYRCALVQAGLYDMPCLFIWTDSLTRPPTQEIFGRYANMWDPPRWNSRGTEEPGAEPAGEGGVLKEPDKDRTVNVRDRLRSENVSKGGM